MKKNIVVCCEDMFDALSKGDLFIDGDCMIRADEDDLSGASAFESCPWCHKELPFPYEEAE